MLSAEVSLCSFSRFFANRALLTRYTKVVQIRFIGIAQQLSHMAPPPQRRYRHKQNQRTAYAAAQARGNGLCPVAIQPYVALVCRLMVSTSRILYVLLLISPTPDGQRADRVGLIG